MMKDDDDVETTITTTTSSTSMMMIQTRRKKRSLSLSSLSPVSIIIIICFGFILSCLISIQTNHRSAILISSTESFVEQYTHLNPRTRTTARTSAVATVPPRIDSTTVDKSTTTTTTTSRVTSAKRIDNNNNNKEIIKKELTTLLLFEQQKTSTTTTAKAEEEAEATTAKTTTTVGAATTNTPKSKSNNNNNNRYNYLRKWLQSNITKKVTPLQSNNITKKATPPPPFSVSIKKDKMMTTSTKCRLETSEGKFGKKDGILSPCEEESFSEEEEEDSETKNTTTTTLDFVYDNVPHPRNGKWAYAYVISGCTETSCNGYILNIIVSSWVLHGGSKYKSKSKADVVVKIRMATTNSNSNTTRLDPKYEGMLHKSNIKFEYLPKVRHDNFGTATLEKFRVLEMLEYERVLFMDADIIPLCNMDYMFEQSYGNGLLSEYVAISGSAAPATASIFLVTPKENEFRHVMDIVKRHHQRSVEPYIFYPIVGWGHKIHPNDKWKTWWESGTDWDFYAAPSDQGLLFHWLKYQQLNYTQIIWSSIQQYREVPKPSNLTEINTTIFEVPDYSGHYHGQIRYIKMINETLNLRKNTTLPKCGGKRWGRGGYSTIAPFADYYHFKGNTKPWKSTISLKTTSDKALSKLSSSSNNNNNKKRDDATTAGYKAWQIWLAQANVALDLGLPIQFRLESTTKSGNPLGLMDNGTDLFSPYIELPRPT